MGSGCTSFTIVFVMTLARREALNALRSTNSVSPASTAATSTCRTRRSSAAGLFITAFEVRRDAV